MNPLELTGRIDTHIIHNKTLSFSAEKRTTSAFLEMKYQAEKDGILMSAYSSYRDFNSQLNIWNAKYSGQRALYSPEGKILNFDSLSENQLVLAILSWSALPGASRHHWGTEIDIIDTAAIPQGYKVKLIPEEFRQEGVFYKLDCWLEEHKDTFGFFKPYREFKGGVCEEPWHLSYAPVSKELLQNLTIDMVEEAISDSAMLGKEMVLETLPDLFRTYVLNVCE